MPTKNGCRLAITVNGVFLPERKGTVMLTGASYGVYLETPHPMAVVVFVDSSSIFPGVPEYLGSPCLGFTGRVEILGRFAPDGKTTLFEQYDREVTVGAYFYEVVEVLGTMPEKTQGLLWDPRNERWFRPYPKGGTLVLDLTLLPVPAKKGKTR